MCLAQGHNAVTPVRLKPTPWSRVKHATTEPLGSRESVVVYSLLLDVGACVEPLFCCVVLGVFAEEERASCFT